MGVSLSDWEKMKAKTRARSSNTNGNKPKVSMKDWEKMKAKTMGASSQGSFSSPQIEAEKAARRKQGLAVSRRDDRVAPTLGGSILRDVLKVPATLLARPLQVGKALLGKDEEGQKIKSRYLGDIETSKNAKDVVKDAGRALELISYGIGVGGVKSAVAATAKQSAKRIALRTAAMEGVAGFVGGSGRAITEEQKGLEALKTIGLSTIGGAVLGGGLGYLGGRLGGKVLSATERAAQRAFKETGGKPFIPKAGTPPIPKVKPLEPDFVYEPINPKTNKLFTKAEKLRQNELPTVDIDTNITKPKGRVVPSDGVSTSLEKSALQTKGLNEAPFTESIPAGTSAPKEAVNESKIYEALKDIDINESPELRLGNLKDRANKIAIEYASNPSKVERIARGIEASTDIRQTDALGALSKIAEDAGDFKLIDRLSSSNVGSQAGSDFTGLKLAGKNNVVGILRELKMSIKERLPKVFKKSEKETKQAVKKLNKYFKENNIPKKEFGRILDDFKCK